MSTIKSNNVLILILALVCMSGLTTATRFRWGKCPELTLATEFDTTKFVGPWYEISRDLFSPHEWGMECVTENF